MYIYKKRTRKNKIKQNIQRFIFQILAVIGMLYLLNCGIEYLKTIDLTKKIIIENDVADVVEVAETSAGSDASAEQMASDKSLTALTPVQQTIKQIADKYEVDWKLVYAICLVESGCQPGHIGDGGASKGYFQIYQTVHKTVTDEQANDLEWSAEFSIKRCLKYKSDKKLFAACHNGIGKYPRNEWYVLRVQDEYSKI